MEIERNVIVGNPYARLSRFVAAAVRVARDHDADMTVAYGESEADAKRVLVSIMVLGKAGRGEQVLVRPKERTPGRRWKPMPDSWKENRAGSAGTIALPTILVILTLTMATSGQPETRLCENNSTGSLYFAV